MTLSLPRRGREKIRILAILQRFFRRFPILGNSATSTCRCGMAKIWEDAKKIVKAPRISIFSHPHIRFFLLAFIFVISCGFAREEDPLAVYLTWQRSPETTMTVQWISYLDKPDDLVEYQKEGESTWYYTRGRHMRMPERFPYYIHATELTGLSPDTIYLFRTNHSPTVYKFKTMPTQLADTSIRFVVGGDIYHDGIDLVHATNRQAAKTDPMFALIGGDIAYAAGKQFNFLPNFMHPWLDALTNQKVDRWLMWLIAWQNDMVTSDGRLIPFCSGDWQPRHQWTLSSKPSACPFLLLSVCYAWYQRV